MNQNSFQISSSKLQLSFQTKGAELNSVVDKCSGFEFIWQANPKIWNRHAPVLFPIVGKLNQNTVLIKDKTYQMNQHGFARDIDFELIELYTDTISFLLKTDEVTKKLYPYDFNFIITYQLNENALIISYKVFNSGEETMFFSVGGHPAFNLPVKDLSVYQIEFEKAENLNRCLLKDGMFTGLTEDLGKAQNILELNKEIFHKDAIVFKDLQSTSLALVQPGTTFKIGLQFDEFRYLGLWAKYPYQDFICLEPWAGLADSVNFDKDISVKEGIMPLNSGVEREFSYTLTFDAP